MIRVSNIRLGLDESKALLEEKIIKKLNIKKENIIKYSIYKESIDARDKQNIYFLYTINVFLKNEKNIKHKDVKFVSEIKSKIYNVDKSKLKNRPIVIGFGPAGIFAALTLAKAGLSPIVYERGETVDDRIKSVNAFWESGILNAESNVQFGEGGAGTFSDGKLTARIKGEAGKMILDEFVKAGAPSKIMYMAHPHIGTDIIRDVVKSIRKKIIELGGSVNFNSKVTDFLTGEKTGVVVNGKEIYSDNIIIAIGHSARDTFENLFLRSFAIEAKEFAVGFRAEHKQTTINKGQYGKNACHPSLKAAEYRLVTKTSENRGVYTFCMCPGGYVVASSSEEGYLVTNGMSYYDRAGENANSAVLAQVKVSDFKSDHPLSGVEFQRSLEKKAFELGGKNYKAPYQSINSYIGKKADSKVTPTYKPGVKEADLNLLFPASINKALKEGLENFSKKIKGFELGVITGVETRTSSPVRILRSKETLESKNVKGFYPCGEGSGYSGGIITSAIDGVKVAESIINKYM